MQYTELIDYELSLPIQYAGPLKGLCIYNELNFINRLTEKQKQKLVNHHSIVIRLEISNSFSVAQPLYGFKLFFI